MWLTAVAVYQLRRRQRNVDTFGFRMVEGVPWGGSNRSAAHCKAPNHCSALILELLQTNLKNTGTHMAATVSLLRNVQGNVRQRSYGTLCSILFTTKNSVLIV